MHCVEVEQTTTQGKANSTVQYHYSVRALDTVDVDYYTRSYQQRLQHQQEMHHRHYYFLAWKAVVPLQTIAVSDQPVHYYLHCGSPPPHQD